MARINMADIARAANVSSMTVSRAFKESATVSNATRQRIMKIADEMGYVFDSTASNLRSKKSGFIAVIVPSINNANFAQTVRAMSDTFRAAGLQILLGYTNYDTLEEERLIEQLLQRRPEAIVLTGGQHTAKSRKLLCNAGIPVVETWDLPKKPIGHVVGFSNATAGKLMLDHFVTQGYRRIGFIGGDESGDARGLERRLGFIKALEAHKLDSHRIIASQPPPITMREGALSMAELLHKWPDTEAVMCVSDLSAFGALTECQRRGIDVPEQIAIGGFGAYDIAEHCVPPLTTIDANAAEIGLQAANVLLNHLQTITDETLTELAPQAIHLTPKLLHRGTTAR